MHTPRRQRITPARLVVGILGLTLLVATPASANSRTLSDQASAEGIDCDLFVQFPVLDDTAGKRYVQGEVALTCPTSAVTFSRAALYVDGDRIQQSEAYGNDGSDRITVAEEISGTGCRSYQTRAEVAYLSEERTIRWYEADKRSISVMLCA